MQSETFSNQAIWNIAPYYVSSYETLTKGTVVDVAIIGAGITGISTAYNLARKGLKVAIVESGKVGMGSTGSSTGNLYIPTAKFKTILSKHNEKALSAVVSSRASALGFIEERIREFDIDCGFTRVPWNYFTSNDGNLKEIENEREAMETTGLNISGIVPPGFRFSADSIITVDNQAQFNPLQYVRKLASSIIGEKCRIYENTRVTAIADGEPCLVETDKGVITAGKVVQATHTPKGIYAIHAMMEVYREYAVAAKLRIPVSQGIYWALDGEDKYLQCWQ
ncbi:MAG TPA: FAD-dependent oxidoreductase [Bacteroidales bacterium]|nr:FAD-dependent oxidoreductase [Bacteroidales bacterium]